MALPPAIITAGSAVAIAANPAIAVPVVAAYAANMAVRASFRVAEYQVQQAEATALSQIASHLNSIKDDVSDILSEQTRQADAMYTEVDETDVRLADSVKLRVGMPDELHVHINTLPGEETSDERWYTKP